ncbi:cobaltochelatase subunit CobN [Hydrogenobacter sp. T-2]|uniref:cobaltochelatase subunit CobN n=1 Tax=Pampinifervens diazotrophicum TaxID=1632018 RepID=UPI002B25CDE3|nr:cobaltochelatase subunit CobN [Hydrogenobacter sp. T-2]WPM31352.1 cobaltochelatase subunit CobN [Hydrogenobacter sp. T-2]
MRFVVALLFLLSFAFAQRVVFVMSFPNPPKKLQLLLQSAKEEGLPAEGFYLTSQNYRSFIPPPADLYIIDAPPEEIRSFLEENLRDKRYILLSQPPSGQDKELLDKLYPYYHSGGRENFRNMIRILLGLPAEPPRELPMVGFYHPKRGVMDRIPTEVQKPLLVLFHRSDLTAENTEIVDQLILSAEKRGISAFGFYYPEREGLRRHLHLLTSEGKPIPSVLINLRLMYFAPDDERKAFEELGVPVLLGLTYRGKLEDWENSKEGIPIALIPFYFALPEYVGAIDPTVVGYDHHIKRPIERMLENLVERAIGWRELQDLENSQKSIALVYYNYPPGDRNILASNLNVIRSFELLLKEAKARGYKVEELSERQIESKLTHLIGFYYRKAVNRQFLECLPLEDYLSWYESLPQRIREEIELYWGKPQKDPYLKGSCFPIPIYRTGNFAFLPLAPRGVDYLKNRELYHSTKVPPSHYYLAFYLFLQKHFHAIVHFGTHGTQEWTPGKERGLDLWDYPYLTLGGRPVIYPYIVDNVGEAVNARRRGRALIISHQTPAFAPSGTYGELEELHQLLHKESQAEGRLKETLRRDIAQRAIKARIAQDMGYKSQREILRNFEDFSERLHNYLHELASQNIPLGLHTFGRTKDKELIALTLLQMLGEDWVRKYEEEDYKEFLARPIEAIKTSQAYRKLLECIEKPAQEECGKVQELYTRFDASTETKAFFSALEGKYIPTSYGGDPIKNPDALPTGRNLYSFDPSRVPTPQAWKTAVQVNQEWLRQYYQKHKAYPQKVAFTLWSTETMRHFGVVEAQILHLLGVKPKWDEGGRVVGLEVIPKEELKRPRIDVVVSATGLYRDHFPNLMNLINQAVRLVAGLEEEENFVRENTQRLKEMLLRRGFDQDKAFVLATVRSFSNESGAYGSGLDEAVFQTRNKKTLSDLFLHRMGYAYDTNLYSEKVEGLFEENLKGTKAVILSRSSNLYGMLTTDDPFQYLGGLALAVETISGQKPEVLIANLRSNAKVQTAEEFLIQEVRARYTNPQYVKALMQEGYSGVNELLNTLNNLYGWQVVAPQVVKDYIWQEFKEVYLEDRYNLGTKRWLMQNFSAMKQIQERLSQGIGLSGYSPNQGRIREGTDTPQPAGVSELLKGSVLQKVSQQAEPMENSHEAKSYSIFLAFILALYMLGLVEGLRRRSYA